MIIERTKVGYMKKIQKFCKLLITIDYVAKELQHVDIAIHSLFGPKQYTAKKTFFDLKYAMVRKDFFQKSNSFKITKQANTVLILQGGADTRCFSPKILKSFNTIKKSLKITIVLGPAFECWDELDKQFHEMSIEQEIELDTHIEDGQRMTKQGYATQYIIYNGTAKSERIGFEDIGHNVTKGAETLYIGEVWKAPEYNLLVVSMGIAVISNEELNDQTGIVFIDDWINENVPNPNDSTKTKNWEELYELIPAIVCIGQN